VSLRQQVFTSLSESLEQAGVLGLMLGGMVGVFWAFGRQMMATGRQRDPDDYAEFARLRDEAKEDLRRLWRRVRRSAG